MGSDPMRLSKQGAIQINWRAMTEIRPTIIIDSREQRPLPITAFPVETETLPCGDYTVKGFGTWENPQFVIERKSIPDLINSLTSGRARFMKEVEKLRQFRFAAILIEGREADVVSGAYLSRVTPQSILASLSAIQVRAGVHVIWAMDRDGAVTALERLVRQFCRGVEKDYRRLLKACETTTRRTTGFR